jgi:hypothetical protein
VSDSYIALTIKVTIDDDKWAAKHQAEAVHNALSTLLRAAGSNVSVYSAVHGDTERAAVERLDEATDHSPRETSHVFKHALVYAITTDGCGRLYLENELEVVASTPTGNDESFDAFATGVRVLLQVAEHADA